MTNRDTTRWFETDHISSFAMLAAHKSHDETIQMVPCHHPSAKLTEEECKGLRPEVESVVSVLHGGSHHSVLEADIGLETLEITDGLSSSYRLKTWTRPQGDQVGSPGFNNESGESLEWVEAEADL